MFLCQGAALDLKQERGALRNEVIVDMPGAGSRPTVSKPHGLRMSFIAVHSKMNGDGAPGSGTHHAELNSASPHRVLYDNIGETGAKTQETRFEHENSMQASLERLVKRTL